MDRRYLTFDIEIAKVLPEEVDDLKIHRPLGICCAATFAEDAERPQLWYTCATDGKPSPQMSRGELSQLVDFLNAQVEAGYTIVTWNGLGFDFDILAEESGRVDDCKRLAVDHVDMMFHVFCEKGFAVSLDAAAKGIRTRGKPPGMNAAMAPKLWEAGRTNEVLDYVANDCEVTLKVATVNERRGHFVWVTRRGSDSSFDLPSGWLPARLAMSLPKPDTSWMTSPPWPRSKFTGWVN
jgi:hypothetical protein